MEAEDDTSMEWVLFHIGSNIHFVGGFTVCESPNNTRKMDYKISPKTHCISDAPRISDPIICCFYCFNAGWAFAYLWEIHLLLADSWYFGGNTGACYFTAFATTWFIPLSHLRCIYQKPSKISRLCTARISNSFRGVLIWPTRTTIVGNDMVTNIRFCWNLAIFWRT